MDLFNHIPNAKLNNTSITYPSVTDPTALYREMLGNLGQRAKLRRSSASRWSHSSFTLKEGVYQFVRTSPTFAASLGSYINGRPLFWADKANFVVTPDAAVNTEYAGQALNSIDAKGDLTFIQIQGSAPFLGKATAFTKGGSEAIRDMLFLSIGSSLATVDVLADGTALTTTNFNELVGYADEVPVAGSVKLGTIFNPFENYYDGII